MFENNIILDVNNIVVVDNDQLHDDHDEIELIKNK